MTNLKLTNQQYGFDSSTYLKINNRYMILPVVTALVSFDVLGGLVPIGTGCTKQIP